MTKVADNFQDPNAKPGKVESTGWPSYRFDPLTGEKRRFDREADVPDGWLESRPAALSPPAEASDHVLEELDAARAASAKNEAALDEALAEVSQLQGRVAELQEELAAAQEEVKALSAQRAEAVASDEAVQAPAKSADAPSPAPENCDGAFKSLDMTRKQIMAYLKESDVRFAATETNDQLAARALAVEEDEEDEQDDDG